MNNDYCPFCAFYVDPELDYDDLMNYPLSIGSGRYAVDVGKFDMQKIDERTRGFIRKFPKTCLFKPKEET